MDKLLACGNPVRDVLTYKEGLSLWRSISSARGDTRGMVPGLNECQFCAHGFHADAVEDRNHTLHPQREPQSRHLAISSPLKLLPTTVQPLRSAPCPLGGRRPNVLSAVSSPSRVRNDECLRLIPLARGR